MQVVYRSCCGIDVHKKFLVACVIVSDGAQVQQQTRRFATFTADLLKFSQWLTEQGCTHVAIESTGVYWQPIYNILEGSFELLLVNTQQVRMVPGRKTDVKDAEWLAELLRHGLMRSSFVPQQPQRELRELTRMRTRLIQQRAAMINRLHKLLESANLKLGSVVSDIRGTSATQMLRMIADGVSDPDALAAMARGRLKAKHEELRAALGGRVSEHTRFLLDFTLTELEHLDASIGTLDQRIEVTLRPFDPVIERLDTIPGVDRRSAENLLAEIGTDMSRFASQKSLAAWAGMCPGTNETAGKRLSGKTRKANRWLRHTLVEAAHAAKFSRNSYASALYGRIARRRGKRKAIVALGHHLLVASYFIIRDELLYCELGAQYFDERARVHVERQCVRRLEKLGYHVELQPLKNAA
jgi:transposase